MRKTNEHIKQKIDFITLAESPIQVELTSSANLKHCCAIADKPNGNATLSYDLKTNFRKQNGTEPHTARKLSGSPCAAGNAQ